MPVTSTELKSLVLRAMQRKNQQRLMEVKMTRELKKCLHSLMAEISTTWISHFFVITAYVRFLSIFFLFLPLFLRFSLPSFKLFLQGSGEQSQELYTFHEAVSQLQDAEDKLMDDDRNNIEVSLLNLVRKLAKLNPSLFYFTLKKRLRPGSEKFYTYSTEARVLSLIGCYLRAKV